MYSSLLATDDEEVDLLENKTIPFFERQLNEAKKRLEQLCKEKPKRVPSETDPPRNGASASPAA